MKRDKRKSAERKGTLGAPAWIYRPDGVLWLFRFSRHGRIICEIRDPVRRTAWFSCLDERDGKPLWDGLAFDEPWWIGIEEAHEPHVYFHGYRRPDLPGHLGVMAVEIESGRKVWERGDVTYLFAFDDAVYVVRRGFETTRYFALDPCNGSLLHDLGEDGIALQSLRLVHDERDVCRACEYPSPLDIEPSAADAEVGIVSRFLDLSSMQGTPEVLTRGSFIIASWHAPSAGCVHPGTLDQHIAFLDRQTGEILFQDVIHRGISVPLADSFLVKGDMLLYVKDDHQLTAHHLAGLQSA
ncbi:MAG: DUF4905 domain-containing protein [Bacteroidota bacterium]|nr:DUF4905 domain-containing protein [Bacteroidota bacterium]